MQLHVILGNQMTKPTFIFTDPLHDISVSSFGTETQFDDFVEAEDFAQVKLSPVKNKLLDSHLQRWKSGGYGASMDVLPEYDDCTLPEREKSDKSYLVPPKRPSRNSSMGVEEIKSTGGSSANLPPRRPNRSKTTFSEDSSKNSERKTNLSEKGRICVSCETFTSLPSCTYSAESVTVRKVFYCNNSSLESLNSSKIPRSEVCSRLDDSNSTDSLGDAYDSLGSRHAPRDFNAQIELEDDDSEVLF